MLVKRLPFLILAGALLYAVGAFADAQAEPLSGKDLKAFVAGRHVYLKVPLGGEVMGAALNPKKRISPVVGINHKSTL